MARAIAKNTAKAIIYAIDATQAFDVDENGMPKANVTVYATGKPSAAKAQRLVETRVGHKNVMILNIEVEETALSLDSETFRRNSLPCVAGVSYGHDCVCQTFKVTKLRGFYLDTEKGLQQFEDTYNGTTTPNKLLNFARSLFPNATITNTIVEEEKRYMLKERYIELAKRERKTLHRKF